MDCYKIKTGKYPQRNINKEQFETDTQKQAPWHRVGSDRKIRNHAVCPACDNPIQIIGLYEPIKNAQKPYGRHTGKAVEGFPYFNPYEYETCRYVRKGRVGNKNNRRKVISPLTLKIIQIVREDFDLIIQYLQEITGFTISYHLAEEMLRHYMAEGYLYVDANLQNIPWVFAYMSGSHSLFGQAVLDQDLHSAILERVKHAHFDDGSHRLIKSPTGFYEIAFCFIHHEVIDVGAGEQMRLSVTTRDRQIVHEKEIKFDYEAFDSIQKKPREENTRNTRLLEISHSVINDFFPNLDEDIPQ